MLRQRVHVKLCGQSLNRTQSVTGRTRSRISVFKSAAEICDSGTFVQGQYPQPGISILPNTLAKNRTRAGMLQNVGGQFGDCNRDSAALGLAKPSPFRAMKCQPPGLPCMRRVAELHKLLRGLTHCYFHRVTVTVVPSPTWELISNSLTNRFAPPSPNPRPEPVVKPSRRASWTSRMPGPLS